LREGKEVPPELEQRLTKSKSQSKEVGKGENSDTQTDDIKILNEKVIHVYKFDGKLISEEKLDIFLNYIQVLPSMQYHDIAEKLLSCRVKQQSLTHLMQYCHEKSILTKQINDRVYGV
jgi:hypothetical protein